ncbi:MAG TPA: LuxR C-terminal-related transcriptional regulator [Actinomycetes bacterium]|nr:LuxR C-terminal-related transcriptional regulator [Actinomycetes bacterium]
MEDVSPLRRGRDALREQAWQPAFALLTEADAQSALEAPDLEHLAGVAYLVGQDEASVDAWARAYQLRLDDEELPGAARCAFWAAFQLLNAGEVARGGGWLARAQSCLNDCGVECAERGLVLAALGVQQLSVHDLSAARSTLGEALEIGRRLHDCDVLALARLGLGHVAVLEGDSAGGVALFDEVMVSVTAGEVQAVVAGIAYCATIIICQETYDLGRANEWTRALSRWSESQPDLVPYRGQCLVHRSEIMQRQGDWSDAMREVHLARARLSDPPGQPAVGMAHYQQGELHRLRGEFVQANQAFRLAHTSGHEPQPGLALLALAQGRVEVARSAIQLALDEAPDRLARSRLLPACVEIELAAAGVEAATAAADELSALAAELRAPLLVALATQAQGSIELASGEAQSALHTLRKAWRLWQELSAPYDAARVRMLIGLARRELGDSESAEMEFDAARVAFHQLGAAHDVVTVERLMEHGATVGAGSLTSREVQVLRLLATGATNRAIALELVISEKTVARHVSNIFAKLDVSSRSAATAYAYEHGVV